MGLGRNIAVMLAANLWSRGLGIATFALSRRLLGPEASGVWSLVQMVTAYAVAVGAGTSYAVEREVPYWRGRGDAGRETQARNLSFSANLVEAVFFAVAILAAVAVFGRGWPVALRVGLVWAALHVFLWRMLGFLETCVRSTQRFGLVARTMGFFSFFDLALVFALVAPFRLEGQLAAFALGCAARAAFYLGSARREGLFRLAWFWDGALFRSLAAVGFPLVVNGFLWQAVSTVDTFVVAKRLGLVGLGLYSVGLSVGRLLGETLTSFSTVIAPRLVERFGERENLAALGRDVELGLRAVWFLIVPALYAVLYFAAPLGLAWFLPAFTGSLESLRLLTLAGVATASVNLPSQIFLVRQKTARLALWTGIFLPVCLATSWAGSHWGIFGAAAGAAVARVLFLGAVAAAGWAGCFGPARAARALAALGGAVLWTAAVPWVVDRGLSTVNFAPLARAAAGWALATALYTGLFWVAARDLKLRERWRARRAGLVA